MSLKPPIRADAKHISIPEGPAVKGRSIQRIALDYQISLWIFTIKRTETMKTGVSIAVNTNAKDCAVVIEPP